MHTNDFPYVFKSFKCFKIFSFFHAFFYATTNCVEKEQMKEEKIIDKKK